MRAINFFFILSFCVSLIACSNDESSPNESNNGGKSDSIATETSTFLVDNTEIREVIEASGESTFRLARDGWRGVEIKSPANRNVTIEITPSNAHNDIVVLWSDDDSFMDVQKFDDGPDGSLSPKFRVHTDEESSFFLVLRDFYGQPGSVTLSVSGLEAAMTGSDSRDEFMMLSDNEKAGALFVGGETFNNLGDPVCHYTVQSNVETEEVRLIDTFTGAKLDAFLAPYFEHRDWARDISSEARIDVITYKINGEIVAIGYQAHADDWGEIFLYDWDAKQFGGFGCF